MNKILKLLGVIFAVCFCQAAVCQSSWTDSVKVYLKVGGACDILPSEKLQYTSFQSIRGSHSKNKDYSDLSASALGGVEFGPCRLEVGSAFSWIEDNHNGVTAKDVAIPMSFSVRLFRVSGFGFYLGARFVPYRVVCHHYRIPEDISHISWGRKSGMFLELDKDITRNLSIFAAVGFTQVHKKSIVDFYADDHGDIYQSPMYYGNTINVGIGVLWNIVQTEYKHKKSGE